MSNSITFDSLSCAQRLQATGLPESWADAITEMFTEVRCLPTIAKHPPKGFNTLERFKKLCTAGLTEAQAEAFLGELMIAFWGIVPSFYQKTFEKVS